MAKITSFAAAIVLICTIVFVNIRVSRNAILGRTKVGLSSYAPKDASFPEHLNTKDDKMCVIHVGPHKTGSTTLQRFFLNKDSQRSRDALKQDNYEVPFFPNRDISETNHAGFANCLRSEEENNLRCPNERFRSDTFEYFQSFVKNVVENGSNILLTSEAFDRPDLNMTELASYVVPEYKIHVVLYYRRFYDWIYSLYNQIAKSPYHPKNIGHLTFVEWLTQDELDYYEPMYSAAVYNRYQEAPEVFNVSVVNMHEDPGDFDTLERFCCDHMQVPHVCELATSQVAEHRNPSVDLDMQLFRARIQQYHSIKLSHGRWPRIQHKLNKMTDIPQVCLSSESKDKLLKTSLETEIALTPKWWQNSDEGLKNLKSDFERKSKSKLCSLDIETILTSSEWQNFLTELEEMK